MFAGRAWSLEHPGLSADRNRSRHAPQQLAPSLATEVTVTITAWGLKLLDEAAPRHLALVGRLFWAPLTPPQRSQREPVPRHHRRGASPRQRRQTRRDQPCRTRSRGPPAHTLPRLPQRRLGRITQRTWSALLHLPDPHIPGRPRLARLPHLRPQRAQRTPWRRRPHVVPPLQPLNRQAPPTRQPEGAGQERSPMTAQGQRGRTWNSRHSSRRPLHAHGAFRQGAEQCSVPHWGARPCAAADRRRG
jgi:hypothetical protein